MLNMINSTLSETMQQASGLSIGENQYIKRLLDIMEYDEAYSSKQLMELLKLKSKENFRKLYLNPAIKAGLVMMSIPDKPTSRSQTYIRK